MGRIEIVSTEEDRVYASKRDWQCPDIPFAPIDKHHVISNSKICWSFFFSSSKSSMPPKSCVLKRALRETLRFFPLSRKVVDFPIIPSLSGREECGVYWKELDVLYHRSDDESDDDEPNEMAKNDGKSAKRNETIDNSSPFVHDGAENECGLRSGSKGRRRRAMGSFNIFCEALRVRWRLVENVSFILLSCHRRATRATTTNTRPKAPFAAETTCKWPSITDEQTRWVLSTFKEWKNEN